MPAVPVGPNAVTSRGVPTTTTLWLTLMPIAACADGTKDRTRTTTTANPTRRDITWTSLLDFQLPSLSETNSTKCRRARLARCRSWVPHTGAGDGLRSRRGPGLRGLAWHVGHSGRRRRRSGSSVPFHLRRRGCRAGCAPARLPVHPRRLLPALPTPGRSSHGV